MSDAYTELSGKVAFHLRIWGSIVGTMETFGASARLRDRECHGKLSLDITPPTGDDGDAP